MASNALTALEDLTTKPLAPARIACRTIIGAQDIDVLATFKQREFLAGVEFVGWNPDGNPKGNSDFTAVD